MELRFANPIAGITPSAGLRRRCLWDWLRLYSGAVKLFVGRAQRISGADTDSGSVDLASMEQNLTTTLSMLAATPPAFDALLRHLPEPLTLVTEGEGTWTIRQVLAHLIHGERTDWLPRVQILLRAGESEVFPLSWRTAV